MARISASAKPYVLSERDRHLVSRFSYGLDEATIKAVRSAGGANAWLAKQLKPTTVSDSAGNAVAGWFPRLHLDHARAAAEVRSGKATPWDYGLQMSLFTLARKIVTTRQVQEVMTDFWSNLLYVQAADLRSFPWRFSYDKTIRDLSLTSYRQLLQAAVVHPAMSGWLTNYDSSKKAVNENLGRELLELFTVGRPAGYTEDDVRDTARLLTGFRVDGNRGYAASYAPEHHWTGPVKILGFRHANSDPDGRAAVAALLAYLATHPATAQRVAERLCRRFVSDTPSAHVVSTVAKAYLASGSDVKATLKALYTHPEFLAARRGMLRSPVDDVVNTARVLGLRPTRPTRTTSFGNQVLWAADAMGQLQFGWPRPDGFPETTTAWASPARMLRSWEFHYAAAGNWHKSTELSRTSKTASLPSKWPRTLADVVEHQSRMLLGRTTDPATLAAVVSMLGIPAKTKYKSAAKVTDHHLTAIRGSILNSPEGMLR